MPFKLVVLSRLLTTFVQSLVSLAAYCPRHTATNELRLQCVVRRVGSSIRNPCGQYSGRRRGLVKRRATIRKEYVHAIMAPSRFSHAHVNSRPRIAGSPYHLSQRPAVFLGIERSDSQSSIASSTTSQDTVVVDPYQGEELKLKANAPVASTSARPLQRERTWGSFSGPTAKDLCMQKARAERTAELLAATAAALTPTRTNTPTPVASSAPVGVSHAKSVSCQSSQSSQISWGCSDDDDCDEDRHNRSSSQREDREKTPTPLPDTTLVDPWKPYFEELEDYTPVEPVEAEQEEPEIELISSCTSAILNRICRRAYVFVNSRATQCGEQQGDYLGRCRVRVRRPIHAKARHSAPPL